MATIKQKIALKEITENNRSVSKAMEIAGYSTKIKKPSQLTRSKGFKELLSQYGVTDDKLAKVLNDGLDATKTIVMGKESTESFVDIQPDYAIRHKYLETGLKLRGYAKEEAPNININFINQIPRPNGSISTEPETQS